MKRAASPFVMSGILTALAGLSFIVVVTGDLEKYAGLKVAQAVEAEPDPKTAAAVSDKTDLPACAPVAPLTTIQPPIWAYPEFTNHIPEKLAFAFVSGGRVNLREAPGIAADILDTVLRGSLVMLRDENQTDWLQIVELQTGQEGWMHRRYLSSERPAEVTSDRIQLRSQGTEMTTKIMATDIRIGAELAEGFDEYHACPCR